MLEKCRSRDLQAELEKASGLGFMLDQSCRAAVRSQGSLNCTAAQEQLDPGVQLLYFLIPHILFSLRDVKAVAHHAECIYEVVISFPMFH